MSEWGYTIDVEKIKNIERLNIIKNIIGGIEGIGETNCDNKVLKSLDFLDLLLSDIFGQLEDNATYDGYEGSRIDIKNRTIEILKDCEYTIKMAIGEVEK